MSRAATGSVVRLHRDSTVSPAGRREPRRGSVHAPGRIGVRALGRIWVVDNYDSFTENLVHLLAQLGADVCVARNDACTVEDVLAARPRGVVVSPGPLTPREAGISVALIRACGLASPAVPVLGVCLGHQALGVAYGARVARAVRPVHGRATRVFHRGEGVLAGLPSPIEAARYHSLVVSPRGWPSCLVATARSEEGEVMALRHVDLPAEGVQFHPESFLTPLGPRILARFLARCGLAGARRRKVVR